MRSQVNTVLSVHPEYLRMQEGNAGTRESVCRGCGKKPPYGSELWCEDCLEGKRAENREFIARTPKERRNTQTEAMSKKAMARNAKKRMERNIVLREMGLIE